MGLLYSKEENEKTFDELIQNLGIDIDSIENNEKEDGDKEIKEEKMKFKKNEK